MAIAFYLRDRLAGVENDNVYVTTDSPEGRKLQKWLDEGVPKLEGVEADGAIVEAWGIEPPTSPFFGLCLGEHLQREGWDTWPVGVEAFEQVKSFGELAPECPDYEPWILRKLRDQYMPKPISDLDRQLKEFVEEQHPRDERGRFTSAGGASSRDYVEPVKDASGKYEPGDVGKLAGADTSGWKKDHPGAQWGMKKIAYLEGLAANGKWDELVSAAYVPGGKPGATLNQFQKGVLAASKNLLAMQQTVSVSPPANSEVAEKQPQEVLSSKGWKQQGGKLGTEEGGTFTGPDGKTYYVKQPKDVARANNEVLADKLYAAAGAAVVNAQMVEIDGKKCMATEWVEADHANWKDPGTKAAAAKDFALHAWLANHDCIGAGSENPEDNIKVTKDGKLTVIDAGGALEYKGMGGSGKKPAGFGSKADEWDTLRDSSINPTAAKVFGQMTAKQLVDSVEKLKAIDNKTIGELVQKHGNGNAIDKAKMTATLIARKNDLIERADKLAKANGMAEESKPAVPEHKPETEPEKIPPKPEVPKEPEQQQEPVKPIAPSIPSPPLVTSKANLSANKKLAEIYEAAKKGDIAAVEAIKTNPGGNTYCKWQHSYKQQVLAALKSGGEVGHDEEFVHTTAEDAMKSTLATPPKDVKIKPELFPDDPVFKTSNVANKEANLALAAKCKEAAAKGDLDALKALVPDSHPSDVLKSYHANLIINVAEQLNPPPPPAEIKMLDESIASIAHKIGDGMTGKALQGCQKIGYWNVVAQIGGVPKDMPQGQWNESGKSSWWSKGSALYAEMSAKIQQAVYKYTNGWYTKINSALRSHKDNRVALDAANGVMDKSTVLEPGLKLSRKYHADDAHVKIMLNSIGKVVRDSAILSTSTNPNTWSGNVKVQITVGNDVKGLPAKSFSAHGSEDEVLLVPNQNMLIANAVKITPSTPGVSKSPGGFLVYGDQRVQHGDLVIEAIALPTQKNQCCPP